MSNASMFERDAAGSPGLAASMLEALRASWRAADGYQKTLALFGVAAAVFGVFHLVVWIVLGGPPSGPYSWRKPTVFGFSVAVTCLSLAWAMTHLSLRRWLGWLLSASLVLAFTAELVLIGLQKWRGVASHFNIATPFDGAVFGAMGVAIVVVMAAIVVMCIAAFVRLPGASASVALAIRAGLAVLVVSQAFGALVIRNGIPKVVAAMESGEPLREAIQSAATVGEAGFLITPHAVSLHGIQVLPLLALLLLLVPWSETWRLRTLAAAAAGYSGVVVVSAWQALGGRAFLDLSPAGLVVLSASVLAVMIPYGAALLGLRRRSCRRKPLHHATAS
jgi:hypothetical protein